MTSAEFFWRVPTHGDGRSFVPGQATRGDWKTPRPGTFAARTERGGRYVDYVAQVARAAELAGFDGALIPTSLPSEEPLVLAAFLANDLRALRLMTAFQPGFITPAYAAKMTATLQRLLGDRLEWNIITGGSAPAQQAYGDFESHDRRYARTGEWLAVTERLWREQGFAHDGDFYHLAQAGLARPLSQTRRPGVYFSGASDAALTVAAEHADVYLMWLEPLASMQTVMSQLDALAASRDRRLRYGVRVDLIARRTEAEAWDVARAIWNSVDRDTTAPSAMTSAGGGESVGARRQAALRPNGAAAFEDYVVGPGLWSGLGALRPGPTIGIVGSYEQVADVLLEHVRSGITTFILAANPHLEEAVRVGEEVLPLVRAAL